jgi:nicotinamidase-related amidase
VAKSTAVLMFDGQATMAAIGEPVFEGDKLLRRIGNLVAEARARSVPVIQVQIDGSEVDPAPRSTPGREIHFAVELRPGDTVVQKPASHAFPRSGMAEHT